MGGTKLFKRMSKGQNPVLSLGGPRSGIPWHTHGESSLMCFVGRKRWFVYPPASADAAFRGHPFLGSLNWTRQKLPSLKPWQRPLTFLQQPGDFVYLPPGWPHLTLNLDDTLAVGWQDFLDNSMLDSLLKGCEDPPTDPDSCTLLAQRCREGICAFGRDPLALYASALQAEPLHLAAAGHSAELDIDRLEDTADVLLQSEEALLKNPYIDNLTLAYGWIYLAQTTYNLGGDKDLADAYLSRVGRLVQGDHLGFEALALYDDKSGGVKPFDYGIGIRKEELEQRQAKKSAGESKDKEEEEEEEEEEEAFAKRGMKKLTAEEKEEQLKAQREARDEESAGAIPMQAQKRIDEKRIAERQASGAAGQRLQLAFGGLS
ncbi:unnamed protein product [Effrenium voratum]|nr:unnamed protein product [Effrenium voratum]